MARTPKAATPAPTTPATNATTQPAASSDTPTQPPSGDTQPGPNEGDESHAKATDQQPQASTLEGDEPIDLTESEWLERLPKDLRSQPGAQLLSEACFLYGISPESDANELAGFAFYPGDKRAVAPADRADRIVLVTHGGIKLAHPMDAATERRLQAIFGLLDTNPNTGEVTSLPLPDDLTLPDSARDGVVRSRSHLRNTLGNAKEEAARRAAKARARSAAR